MNIEFVEFQITDDGIFLPCGSEKTLVLSRVDIIARTHDTEGKNSRITFLPGERWIV